ncbi:MAG: serine/threonine-protein kinase, partial [Cyanobacteria bacterium J06642_11]
MTDQNLGRILANRYELTKFIDQGAMGSVYLARDILLGGVSVAVKLLSQHILDALTIEQFKTEAKISALLGHKCTNVVRVIDHKLTRDGQPFYVMEYLEGQNIRQIVRVQPLDIPRFLELARQTCVALKAAHAGILFDNQVVPIIHRDIKPSNILVLQASSGELVKVLDFGIAKLLQSSNIDDPRFRGTIAYASPEQMDGQELDCRSDIYSLGITMYEMLTGKLPYRPQRNSFGGWHKVHLTHEPKSLKSVIPLGTSPKLLNGVCDLVMSCLAKKPQQRPASVDEILTGLMTLQQDLRPARTISAKVLPKPVAKNAARSVTAVKTLPDLDWVLRSQTWPSELPTTQENIVPKLLLLDKQQQLPMLWMMLSPEEIDRRMQNRRYNT